MKSPHKRILLGVIFLLVVCAVIAIPIFHSPGQVTPHTGLAVVAAENFWGNIATQIGGKYVHVTSIISDPSADPHLYESSARDAGAIEAAKVVIVNGLGYDDFISKLLRPSQNNTRNVLTVSDVLGTRSSTANPHLWYNIARVPEVANAIAAAYIQADPTNAAAYRQNVQSFNDSLKPLLTTIMTIKHSYSGESVGYTARVPGYVIQAAGLTVGSPPDFATAIEDGNDPGPKVTAEMNNVIINKKIKVLLYNSQAASPVTESIKKLAAQNGIPVIGVTETMPANEPSYQKWQQDQLNALLGALK
jgi:zinc/manganese transport system substrate-binding protein